MVWHPDRFPNNSKLQRRAREQLQLINEAYTTIRSAVRAKSGVSPRAQARSPHTGPAVAGASAFEPTLGPRLAIDTIFHPTDLSPGSFVAFAHALKLALVSRATLTVMHVVGKRKIEDSWGSLPGVRTVLEQWGLLPANSTQRDVSRLGVTVKKVLGSSPDPEEAIVRYLDSRSTDLVVLATHQRHGLARLLRASVAQPVRRRSEIATLFVPNGIKGFVSTTDGKVTIERVLIPVDHDPAPQPAIEAAVHLTRALEVEKPLIRLLYIGSDSEPPEIREPEDFGVWDREVRTGNAVDGIRDAETELSPDLIVLCTQGHQGFLDALRGSTSERIVRGSRCPVLAVPAADVPLLF